MTAEELDELIHAEETPRMRCLLQCQRAHLACRAAAKNDPNKLSACNKKLAQCVKGCPAPIAR